DELCSALFEPFRQGENRRRRSVGGGLGLGLYIVDQIVRSHHGSVSARSTSVEGTTLTVTLPRSVPVQPARDQARGTAETDAPGRSSVKTGKLDAWTVMVVDDDSDVRLGIAEFLEGSGYEVVTASNGAEALESLQKGLRPSLILVDVNMPVMDGEAFCDACRDDAELSSIPVLVISADAAAAVKLARCGASGFLEKPLRAEALLDTIGQVLLTSTST
ncbi:MAG: response regulator, partial [Myxococcaceae bacterium]